MQIPDYVAKTLLTLETAGYEARLVGGCVEQRKVYCFAGAIDGEVGEYLYRLSAGRCNRESVRELRRIDVVTIAELIIFVS